MKYCLIYSIFIENEISGGFKILTKEKLLKYINPTKDDKDDEDFEEFHEKEFGEEINQEIEEEIEEEIDEDDEIDEEKEIEEIHLNENIELFNNYHNCGNYRIIEFNCDKKINLCNNHEYNFRELLDINVKRILVF